MQTQVDINNEAKVMDVILQEADQGSLYDFADTVKDTIDKYPYLPRDVSELVVPWIISLATMPLQMEWWRHEEWSTVDTNRRVLALLQELIEQQGTLIPNLIEHDLLEAAWWSGSALVALANRYCTTMLLWLKVAKDVGVSRA